MRRLLPTRKTRQRLLAINAVLTRRGLKWLASEVGIYKLLPSGEAAPGKSAVTALSLRLALEELGTTFIKFGQVLSTRPDLLSAEYILELQKLQDDVAPVAFSKMEAVFESEFGAKPSEVFQYFDPIPRASASIGQVYDAVLKDGMKVVVKIQRPGLEEQCAQDIEILKDLAAVLVRSSVGERIDVVGAVDEFAGSLRKELDFRIEAANANIIRENFQRDPAIKIPKIVTELSSKRIVTEELITGIRIDDIKTLSERNFDRHELAKRCCHIALTQIFQHRFFHADPHPGNFFVLEDGVVAMIDFGMVGRIDSSTRDTLAKFIPAVTDGDADELAENLLELGMVNARIDRGRLTRDLQRLLDNYAGKKLGDLSLQQIASELVETMRRNGLQFPSNLILLLKVLSIDEGMARTLDPDFQLVEYAAPYFRKFWLEQLSPASIAKQQAKNALDLFLSSKGGIRRISRLMNSVDRGDITLNSNVRIEGPIEEIRTAGKQISRSILIAACLITAGLLFIGFRLH